MITRLRKAEVCLCVSLLAGSLAAAPQAAQPDNTKVNKATQKPTADQQGRTKADRELAQKIRKAVVADKALSTYAHNAKIIVQDGMVTLRGPVRSENEKTSVEAKAREIAGADHVKNELTIAPAKSSKKQTKTE